MAPDFLGYEGDKHEGDVLDGGFFIFVRLHHLTDAWFLSD